MNIQKRLAIGVMAASWLLATAALVRADSVFTVTVNTTALQGNASAPFQIDFLLTDGSGTNDGNNTATVTGFAFGGGAPSGTATTSGGVTGDLASTVTLVDNSFFNNFQQSFTAGSTLSFNVDLTTLLDAGSTPDAFSFYILDNTGSNIPTSDIAGSLLTANINSATPTSTQFVGTGAYARISAVVTSGGTTVPEPSTLLLLGSAVGVLFIVKLFSR